MHPLASSGSIQALLDRLRAAQAGPPDPVSQNGTQEGYQTTGYSPRNPTDAPSYTVYRNPSEPSSFPSTSGSGTYLPQNGSQHASQQPPKPPLSNFHQDLARSDSVQSLLSSLQSARPRTEFIPPPPTHTTTYTLNHYAPPTPTYQRYPVPHQQQQQHQQQQPSPDVPHQQYPLPDQRHQSHRESHTPHQREPPFPTFPHSPTHGNSFPLPPRTSRSQDATHRALSRSPVPPDFSRPPVLASPRAVVEVAPVAVMPTTTTTYDPYDEDYSVSVQEDAGGSDDEPDGGRVEEDAGIAAEAESETRGEEEAEQKRNKEEQEAERLRRAERTTDEFVNMSFGRASAVVTQLMNEESVMRRLKALKDEQDTLEKRLWEKRLEIVKLHREKMNQAKEEAKRMDQTVGDARVMKEKSAAQKALRQFYTSRCLPFYDDLHRKHLEIMQRELGIPGLGRLEPRRRETTMTTAAATPGGAERPIAVDPDDDEAVEQDQDRTGMKMAGDGGAEDVREKALARRRKIMGLIESIMADGMDD